MTFSTHVALLAAIVSGALSSCSKPPADPLCSYETLPATTDVAAGEGAIQIIATTDEYSYVYDSSGKQVKSGSNNRALNLKPGQYNVKLNNSAHPVYVQSKMLTRCTASALRVSGDTDEYYYVFDSLKQQLANHKLGGPLAFFPGNYLVGVNNASASASLSPGSVTELKAGLVNVRGTTDEYYYVFDGAGAQLANNKLSRPLSFLAADLVVKVNGTSAPLKITAGGVANVLTGALLVGGATDEYYYVFDSLGNQLANNKLGRALSFFPGNYTVKVNNSPNPVSVEAGRTNEYQTGTLTVQRSGDDYYYVSDSNGNQIANNKLNRPLALLAGKYSVKVGNDARPVAITAGQTTVVNW